MFIKHIKPIKMHQFGRRGDRFSISQYFGIWKAFNNEFAFGYCYGTMRIQNSLFHYLYILNNNLKKYLLKCQMCEAYPMPYKPISAFLGTPIVFLISFPSKRSLMVPDNDGSMFILVRWGTVLAFSNNSALATLSDFYLKWIKIKTHIRKKLKENYIFRSG